MLKRLVVIIALPLVLLLGFAVAAAAKSTATKTVAVPASTTSPFGSAAATAKCKGRQRFATAGGFLTRAPSGGGDLITLSSRAAGAGGWASRALNGSSAGPGALTSFGYCSKTKPRRIVTAKSEPLEGRGSATARCPRGTSVLGGGFAGEVDDQAERAALVTSLRRPSSRTLRVAGIGISESGEPAGRLTAQALCGRGGGLRERVEAVTSDDTDPVSAKAECRRGERVAFGGFEIETANGSLATQVVRSSKAGSGAWLVGTRSPFFGEQTVRSFAYCG